MKKQFLVFVLTLLSIVASAAPVDNNGIWYNLNTMNNTAEVTKNPSGIKYINNIVIPETITEGTIVYTVNTIGTGAFMNCSGMTSVAIPKSVTNIGQDAFIGCSSLTAVYITDLSAWFSIMFSNQDSNPLFNAHHLFLNGDEVKNLVIPQDVYDIPGYVFNGCSGMTSITFHNTVGNIGGSAFAYCSGLTSVIIPNSVTSIGSDAFRGCSSLNSITISNSVTQINSCTFMDCNGLISANIPEGVTSIGGSAFTGCCSLRTLKIPNSVTTIGMCAFQGCSDLISVTIGNNVTDIQYNAFAGCSSLPSVTIPSNVISIGSEAFTNCTSLTDVYSKPTDVMATSSMSALFAETNAFDGSYPERILLHVPSGSVAAYKAIEPWSKFKNVVALQDDDDTPAPIKCAKPTISYNNGTINFTCSTAGVEFVSSVTSEDVKSYSTASITLSQKYTISVYAAKTGYDNSDVATMDIIITGNGQAYVVGDMDGNGILNATDIVKLVDKIMGQ